MSIPEPIKLIIHSGESKHIKLAKILKYIVDECEIDQSKYYILGSYALRNDRTISDLDINMDSDEFMKLERIKLGCVEFYNNQIRWFYDLTNEYQKVDPTATDFSIEAFKKLPTEGYPSSKYSLGELASNGGLSTDEFGHQFMSLQTLLEWKKEMNRSKDKADIDLIESLIGITGGTIVGGCWSSPSLLWVAFFVICVLLIIYSILPSSIAGLESTL